MKQRLSKKGRRLLVDYKGFASLFYDATLNGEEHARFMRFSITNYEVENVIMTSKAGMSSNFIELAQ